MLKNAGALTITFFIIVGALVAGASDRSKDSGLLPSIDNQHIKAAKGQIYCGKVVKIVNGKFFEPRTFWPSNDKLPLMDSVSKSIIRVYFEGGVQKILHGSEIQKIRPSVKYSMNLRAEKDGTFYVGRISDGEDCQ